MLHRGEEIGCGWTWPSPPTIICFPWPQLFAGLPALICDFGRLATAAALGSGMWAWALHGNIWLLNWVTGIWWPIKRWLAICSYTLTLPEDDSHAVKNHKPLKVSFESSLNCFGKPNLLSLLCQKSLWNSLKSKLYSAQDCHRWNLSFSLVPLQSTSPPFPRHPFLLGLK